MRYLIRCLAPALAAAIILSGQPGNETKFRAVRDITTDYAFEHTPIWSGGALVALENNPSAEPMVRVFNGQGIQAASVRVRIPGANWVTIRRSAHGGGVIAICGSATDTKAHVAGFIALGNLSGRLNKLIRTEPYVPTAISVAPDGTIWTKGAEFQPVKRTPSKTDKGILRHFDAEGKMLGSFLSQSSIPVRNMFLGIDYVACSSKRVGWYQSSGAVGYFEVEGERLQQYPPVVLDSGTAEDISGLTITENGRVFVVRSTSGSDPRLFVLDRLTRTWRMVEPPLSGSPAVTPWLIGGNANTVVFKTIVGSNVLRQFEVVDGQ